jgi:hypothetical protein
MRLLIVPSGLAMAALFGVRLTAGADPPERAAAVQKIAVTLRGPLALVEVTRPLSVDRPLAATEELLDIALEFHAAGLVSSTVALAACGSATLKIGVDGSDAPRGDTTANSRRGSNSVRDLPSPRRPDGRRRQVRVSTSCSWLLQISRLCFWLWISR